MLGPLRGRCRIAEQDLRQRGVEMIRPPVRRATATSHKKLFDARDRRYDAQYGRRQGCAPAACGASTSTGAPKPGAHLLQAPLEPLLVERRNHRSSQRWASGRAMSEPSGAVVVMSYDKGTRPAARNQAWPRPRPIPRQEDRRSQEGSRSDWRNNRPRSWGRRTCWPHQGAAHEAAGGADGLSRDMM